MILVLSPPRPIAIFCSQPEMAERGEEVKYKRLLIRVSIEEAPIVAVSQSQGPVPLSSKAFYDTTRHPRTQQNLVEANWWISLLKITKQKKRNEYEHGRREGLCGTKWSRNNTCKFKERLCQKRNLDTNLSKSYLFRRRSRHNDSKRIRAKQCTTPRRRRRNAPC